MARFYASIKGSRGEATRLGTPASGIESHARGWSIGGSVEMRDRDGSDVVDLALTSGSNGGEQVSFGQWTKVNGQFRPADGRALSIARALNLPGLPAQLPGVMKGDDEGGSK
jgi:hypothetical protein